MPQEWIRKQTLANAERYITQELKEYEEKILGAEDKILVLETQLYTELVQGNRPMPTRLPGWTASCPLPTWRVRTTTYVR